MLLSNTKKYKRKLSSKGILIALVILAMTVLSACGNKDVVATYQGGKVTQSELGKFVSMNMFFDPQLAYMSSFPGFDSYMLDQLITFKVLADRADSAVKSESDKMVKEQMDQITQIFETQGGKGALDKELLSLNLTKRDMQNFMELNFYTMNSVRGGIEESKIKEEFDLIVSEDAHYFDIATVRHILVMTEDPSTGEEVRTREEALKRAQEVRDKLLNNGNFDELAKEYSEDPGSKDKGGQYQDYPVSNWVPEFRDAAVNLAIDEISQPIEVAYGFHVMKVESRSTLTYDQVKEDIQSQLAEDVIFDFMQNELPGLITSNTLPKEEMPEGVDIPEVEVPTTN